MAHPLPRRRKARRPRPIALVGLAKDPNAGIAGVVESRFVIEEVRDAPTGQAPGNPYIRMHSVPGPAQAGDYVLLTIAGVAQVQADPAAAVAPGTRLAVSNGLARPLETRTLDGMLVSEGGALLGTALEAGGAGKDMISVFLGVR